MQRRDDGTLVVRAPSKVAIALIALLGAAGGGTIMSAPQWLVRNGQNTAATVQAQGQDANQVAHESMQRQIDRVERKQELMDAKIDLLLQK